jgi:NADH-quinone oxidoreductase subunit M
MILAGVLLKLGGVGIIRFINLIDLNVVARYTISYFFVFMCYVTLVCCLQSDFKRLVAYSSVSHMMGVPILILSSSFIGFKGAVLLIFFHGVRSPLMFILVGLLYSFFLTRQHVSIRGLIVLSPLLSFVLVLSFFFTMSAPPFPSFVSEVYLRVVSVFISYSFIPFILLFLFLSIVYNLV